MHGSTVRIFASSGVPNASQRLMELVLPPPSDGISEQCEKVFSSPVVGEPLQAIH